MILFGKAVKNAGKIYMDTLSMRKVRGAPARLRYLLLPVILLALSVFAVLAGDGIARWPQQSGTQMYNDGQLTVDASNSQEGYFMAAGPASDGRLKLRVIKGDMSLTYDLNTEQAFEVFPLQLGSGTYEISLYKNIGGKKYAQEGTVVLDVSLTDENAAYLYPNQYIHYSEEDPFVAKADELCAGMGDREAFDAVSSFITSEFVYDFIRALTVQAGELPDLEGCYEKRMGICQDLSAVMVAMLRSRGIPSRMMIGYADANYHAWTETIIDGETIFFDPTAELNAITKPKEYLIERFY